MRKISENASGGMVEYQVIEKAFGIMKTGKAQLVDAGMSDSEKNRIKITAGIKKMLELLRK